jgi:hypothetical protein
MSVPYGTWMGSVIQDSFNPPPELCVEIQRFIADHEHLYSSSTCSETAVVYNVETEFQRESGRGIFADNRYNVETSEIGPFWQACEALSDAVQPYDVLFFPDGDLRPDTLKTEDLQQYRTLILADCRYLTHAQSQLLLSFLENDGQLVVMGEVGSNLSAAKRDSILAHKGTRRVDVGSQFDLSWLPYGKQLQLSSEADIAVNLQRVGNGVAVHILRYDYDSQQDKVPALDELNLDLHLPGNFGKVEVFSPGEPLQAELEVSGDLHRISLQHIPLYSIILLKE